MPTIQQEEVSWPQEMALEIAEKEILHAMIHGGKPPKVVRYGEVTGFGRIEKWAHGQDRFSAVVNVANERHVIDGVACKPGQRSDWMGCAAAIRQSIDDCFEKLAPAAAVRELGRIFEITDRIAQNASAKSRILLGQIDEVPIANEEPCWLKHQLEELANDATGQNDRATQIFSVIVRAAIAADICFEAVCSINSAHHLVLDWCVPQGRVRWVVDQAVTRWPAIKISQLATNSNDRLESRTFIDAHSAIAELKRFDVK